MNAYFYSLRIISIFLILLYSAVANALPNPIKDHTLLREPRKTKVQRVTTAEVLIADYELIRRDFPYLKDANLTEIDQWLLDNSALMSTSQILNGKSAGTNEDIQVSDEHQYAFRPELYGRALVLPVREGLIDVKGCGASRPRLGSDSSGLLDVEEGVEEFILEKLIKTIFEHSQSHYSTIETYAVINLGFNGKDAKKDVWFSAGLLLRQAHVRATENWTCLATPCALKIENLLRHYGISSVGSVEHINVQGCHTSEPDAEAIVDFASYSCDRTFDEPLHDFIPTWDRTVVIANPGDPGFVQPDPNLQARDAFFDLNHYAAKWIGFFKQGPRKKMHLPSTLYKKLQTALNAQKKFWKNHKNQ